MDNEDIRRLGQIGHSIFLSRCVGYCQLAVSEILCSLTEFSGASDMAD